MPGHGTTTINHPKLKDQLEYCMGEGKALVVAGVEEAIDPMLDPVMEKEIIVKSIEDPNGRITTLGRGGSGWRGQTGLFDNGKIVH